MRSRVLMWSRFFFFIILVTPSANSSNPSLKRKDHIPCGLASLAFLSLSPERFHRGWSKRNSDYSKDQKQHCRDSECEPLATWVVSGQHPQIYCEFYILMIKVTISTLSHVLVFYKDNPFPKHPWFLRNPRIWHPRAMFQCVPAGRWTGRLCTHAQVEAVCRNRNQGQPDIGG